MAPIPKAIRLHGEGDTLVVEWSDGHQSVYSYQYLRDRCPCATCTDSASSSAEEAGPLPLFGARVLRPDRAEVVGRYALQIYWNDGHSTGIYTFDYLRELCPCADCEAARDGVF